MIAATTDAFRSVFPELQVDLLCLRTSEEQVLRMGFVPTTMPSVDSYNLLTFPREIAGLFKSTVYDALIVLGADVMDGYYGVTHPAMALIASDIAARHGVSTSIVGASFNQSPAIQLAPLFNQLDPRVNLNIRDPISLERIKAFASVSPRLVADAAFSLTPGVPDGDAAAWIEQERSAGRCVIGVNMHPMLIKDATDADVDRITSCMSLALRAVSANVAVSWILIPHDYRRKFQRDETCLKLIHQKLKSRDGAYYLEGEHGAASLKSLVGHLDGVITGRMHLAIAALGMGVPVLGFVYQGKFEGLLRHFDLPQNLLLPTAIFDNSEALEDQITGFLSKLPELRQKVRASKPHVLALSWQNFAPHLGPDSTKRVAK